MADQRAEITEQIQRLAAALVATHPAGAGLALIGGFRYRLLDRGLRRSVDIDYHWQGDLVAKRDELVSLYERRLLPDVRRQLGLAGSAAPARHFGQEPTAVATVDLAFWGIGSMLGRVEIPIDITRIECIDPPTTRTADGIIYRTASDADLLEAKVIAILGRTFIEHRDLLDLHLFASHAATDATRRVQGKLSRLGVDRAAIVRRLRDLDRSTAHHAKTLDAVIRNQLDPAAAAVLIECGGGGAVLARARSLLADFLGQKEGPA